MLRSDFLKIYFSRVYLSKIKKLYYFLVADIFNFSLLISAIFFKFTKLYIDKILLSFYFILDN